MGQYILQNQEAEGWGTKIINKLSVDLKKEFPALKGFSPRNLLYMKQFAEAYPVAILEQFIYVEQELKGMKSISQQAVAKLLALADGHNEITQQPVAQNTRRCFFAINSCPFKLVSSYYFERQSTKDRAAPLVYVSRYRTWNQPQCTCYADRKRIIWKAGESKENKQLPAYFAH